MSTSTTHTRRPPAKLVVFAGVVVVLFAIMGLFHDHLPSPGELHEMADDWGALGMVIAVPTAALLKLAIFPSSILSIAAGLLYGPLTGTLLIATASTLAACAQLLISRHVAREWVRERLPAKAHDFDAFIEQRGWLAIVILRFIPISHNVVNYATGYTNLKLWHMAVGTFFGSLPMAFAYTLLGSHSSDLGAPEIKYGLTLLALLAIGGVLLGRRSMGRTTGEGRAPAA